MPQIKKWKQETFELETKPIPPWFFDVLAKLRGVIDEDEGGRVRLGLAFDSYGMPNSSIVKVFEDVRQIGVDLITSHWRRLDAHGTYIKLQLCQVLLAETCTI